MAPKVLKLFSKMALFDEMWAPAYFATKAYTRTFFQWLTLPSQKDSRESRFKGQGPRDRGYVLATKDWAVQDTFFVGLGSTFSQSKMSEAYVFTMPKIQSKKKIFGWTDFNQFLLAAVFERNAPAHEKIPKKKQNIRKNWSFWPTRWVYFNFASG